MKKLFSNRLVKSIIAFTVTVILITVMVFVCFNKPKQVKAEVISATVLGVSALLAFLAAQGVSLSFNGVSDDAITSEVNTILNGYSSGGKTWDDWNTNSDWVDWLVGKENKTKFLVLSHEFLSWASDLPDWLKDTFGLQIGNTSTINPSDVIVLDDIDIPIYQSLAGFVNGVIPNTAFPAVPNTTYTYRLTSSRLVNVTFGSIYDYYGDRIDVSISLLDNNDNVLTTMTHSYAVSSGIDFIRVVFANNGYGYLNILSTPLDNGSYTSGYNIQAGIALSEFTIDSIGIEGSLTDGYQDLQDALDHDLTDQTGNPDAVGVIDVGALDGVTQEQLTDDIYRKIVAGDIDIDGVGVDVYDDAPTAEQEKDAEEVPTAVNVESGIVIVDGLEDFFPFCIPFDLYEIIAKLNVEPVTPDFTYTISFGGLFDDAEIEIDLSEFDTVARVFRIMMAVGFAVFLIIKTRDLIRG